VRPGEVCLPEVRPAEDRPVEVRVEEVRPAEVRVDEVRPAAEVRPVEVGRMSGFSSRHAFQAATPCLSNATCSSFAM
jgi:hypothetical protein